MANNYYTQAFNFASLVQGSVDPRTGIFSVMLPIAQFRDCRQLGPALSLALIYSPLQQSESNFGMGFQLNLTQFDAASGILNTSSGEQYRVNLATGTVRQQKGRQFIFGFANGTNDRDGYRLVYKTGQIEHLSFIKETFYAATKIESPAGHALQLSWGYTEGKGLRLLSIKDAQTSVTLCQFSYTADTVISVWPGTDEAWQLEMRFSGLVVDQMACVAGGERIFWQFGYEQVGPAAGKLTAMTSFTTPSGSREQVVYDDVNGMSFPGATNTKPPLPRLIKHTQSPGFGQPDIVRTWTYTDHNYLGFGSNLNDILEDTDNLCNLKTSYYYGSTETLEASTGEPVVTTRTYDKFHLPISEEIRCGKCTKRTETFYYANDNDTFDVQLANFMYPRRQTVTWLENPGRPEQRRRVETTNMRFDDDGNLLKKTLPDGRSIEWEWYPASGESVAGEVVCPAEPNGFVRLLKSMKMIPASSSQSAPSRHQTMTYTKLKTLKGATRSYAVVASTETHYADLIHISWMRTGFIDDPDQAEHGRIRNQTRIYYSPDGSPLSRTYSMDVAVTTTADNMGLTQTTTLTGERDGLRLTRQNTHSCRSQRKLEEIDPQGIKTRYRYDFLGRLISRENAADTDYASTVKSSWQIAITGTGQATNYLEQTDAMGNVARYSYDGAGRLIKEEKSGLLSEKSNHSQQHNAALCCDDAVSEAAVALRVTRQLDYDSQGRLSRETHFDYLPDSDSSKPPVTCTYATSFSYNEWNECTMRTGSDGVVRQSEWDPIALERREQLLGKASGKPDMKLGITVTSFSGLGVPVSIKRLLSDGTTLVSEEVNEYDGLGRLRIRTDSVGQKTRFEYDVYDRLVDTILPDGKHIEKVYALGEVSERVTRLSVNGRALGFRDFDSLGRPTQSTVGERVEKWQYTGSSPLASERLAPGGEITRYSYLPELGNALSGLVALNSQGQQEVEQQLDYDKRSGRLLSASETGSGKVTLAYTADGRLQSETFAPVGGVGRSLSRRYSLQGRLLSYTGPQGTSEESRYDEFGRCTGFIAEDVGRSMEYDQAGRLASVTAVTQRSSTRAEYGQLKTLSEYDDFGREVTRTLTIGDDDAHSLVLTQTWRADDRLATRKTTYNKTTLCAETFTYDSHNRLTRWECSGEELPVVDGRTLLSQTWDFDEVDNITRCVTRFTRAAAPSEVQSDEATFTFSDRDNTQLVRINHTHPDFPASVELLYDANGRLIRDEKGATLSFDALGRLKSVQKGADTATYGYDAWNGLSAQRTGSQTPLDLYYQDDDFIGEFAGKEGPRRRWVRDGSGECAGVISSASASGTPDILLAGTNGAGNLLMVSNKQASYRFSWTPYGNGYLRGPDGPDASQLPGMNGERLDPFSGLYHLGKGERAYSPGLMRFISPDSLSPFGAGGLNSYAWCSGDPINFSDPSGHMNSGAIAGIVLGSIGLAFAAFSFGMSVYAAGGAWAALQATSPITLVSGILGVAADATGIASAVIEESDPGTSQRLGVVSTVFGVGSIAVGAGGVLFKSVRNFRNHPELTVSADAPIELQNQTMRSMQPLTNGILTFQDTYRGGQRLNIVSHGSRFHNSSVLVEKIMPGRIDVYRADDLLKLLTSRGISPENFDSIRIVACYSAFGGERSIAAQFSKLTGKPVMGYKSFADNIPGLPESIELFYELVRTKGVSAAQSEFATQAFSVASHNPYSLFTAPVKYLTFTYLPASFGF